MEYQKYGLSHWERKEHFYHFYQDVRCGFSITDNINITNLLSVCKSNGLSFYPVILYMASVGINSQRELRTFVDDSGEPCYWDIMHPSFTIFHEDIHTFSNLWTEYDADFSVFYERCKGDMATYQDIHHMDSKKDCPSNNFPVSCIPWRSFSGFHLHLFNESQYLTPIITFGKYQSNGTSINLPISIQVHHAAADGYHISKFINQLQGLSDTCGNWLK